MSIDEEIKELERKHANNSSLLWKLNNKDHVKKREEIHQKIQHRLRAIPKLEAKLERYKKEIVTLKLEKRVNMKYKKDGAKRRHNYEKVKKVG